MNNRTRPEAAAEWRRIHEQTAASLEDIFGPTPTREGGPRPGRALGAVPHPDYVAFLAPAIEAEERDEARRGYGVGFATLEDYEAFVAERARKAVG